VRACFADLSPLRVLYVSGMTREKGYEELVEGYLSLTPEVRARIRLDLAGRFDREADREAFERRIAGEPGVTYHGLVSNEEKRALFARAHVFCLPTSMLEGQPISILEAYAAGCVVVTSGQPGIRDVFTHGVHGLELRSPARRDIAAALERLAADAASLEPIARANRALAERSYRSATYCAAISSLLEHAAPAMPAGDEIR
jgi:glycosyltransferase involved in cell wall biosynthesis